MLLPQGQRTREKSEGADRKGKGEVSGWECLNFLDDSVVEMLEAGLSWWLARGGHQAVRNTSSASQIERTSGREGGWMEFGDS